MINNLVASLSRQFWSAKGMIRVANASRNLHLKLGGEPIIIAPQKDGSKLKIDLRSHTEWHAFYSGVYDALWVDICSECLLPGETFLDVGANIGMFSVKVASRNKTDNNVISFEPLPANVKRLNENIVLNNVQDQVQVCGFGLSNETATVNLVLRGDFEAGSKTGNASIAISEEADGTFKKTPISIKRLDDVIEDLSATDISVIKVDIEGHEEKFYEGGQKIISQHRPIIIAEVNRDCFKWQNEELETSLLNNIPRGYKVLRSNDEKHLIKCSNFSEIGRLENIVYYPIEKLDRLLKFISE